MAPHPAGWVPAGIGDFDRDGHLDILWHQGSINRLETWVLTNLEANCGSGAQLGPKEGRFRLN